MGVGGAALLGGWGGWVPRCGQRHRGFGGDGGARGDMRGAAVPPCRKWGGETISSPPPPLIAVAPHLLSPPRSARRSGAWRFVGLGSSGHNAGGEGAQHSGWCCAPACRRGA